MTLEEFFKGQDESRQIFEALHRAIESIGPAEIRISKSQISFRRRKALAWAWMPSRYLKGQVAPLVLSLSFPHRSESSRWKEIVEPKAGYFTHHLELHSPEDVDDEVSGWLREAWMEAC